jgi:hypothetical protein
MTDRRGRVQLLLKQGFQLALLDAQKLNAGVEVSGEGELETLRFLVR